MWALITVSILITTQSMQADGLGKPVVAAIDFGTMYSGYAYSLRNDYLNIKAKQWMTAEHGSLKTSSAILFTPERKFHSFGLDAEKEYSKQNKTGQHHNWYYFRLFKMMLYEPKEGLNRDALLQDVRGKTMSAMQVFSAAIRYLKDQLILNAGLNNTYEIHWVLTVPGIWTDPAKQFMREAATMAGIDGDSLTLALEPEAAFLHYQNVPVERLSGAKEKDAFPPGSKHLVMDAGGGTVDITVQEVQNNSTLIELFKPNGGPWGATKIDEAFLDFLANITSNDVMEAFVRDHTADYIELLTEFETKKQTITPGMDQRLSLRIPVSLHEDVRQGLMMKDEFMGTVTFTGGILYVEADTVKQFFNATCDHIVNHLKEVLGNPSVNGTDTIVMVGGFSESPMLQHAVKTAFLNFTVIIADELELAVLKGAVIFGHKPKAIAVRICRYTYGIETCLHSGVEKRTREKRLVHNNQPFCVTLFRIQTEIGRPFYDGEPLEWQEYPITYHQKTITGNVYACDQNQPKSVDDIGCMKLGQLMVDLQDQQHITDRSVLVRMILGGTELDVEAKQENTGITAILTVNFDFLG